VVLEVINAGEKTGKIRFCEKPQTLT